MLTTIRMNTSAVITSNKTRERRRGEGKERTGSKGRNPKVDYLVLIKKRGREIRRMKDPINLATMLVPSQTNATMPW